MTRRDYNLIAGVFRAALTAERGRTDETIAITITMHLMARTLAENNPRFDIGQFIANCTPEATV
jgi:hypothetical protein